MRVPTIREFFLYFLVFLLTIIIGCQHSQKKQLQETVFALGDSLKQTTNKFGELQSSRTVIQGSVNMLQKLVESKDSTIAMLSKKVTRRTIATGVVIQSITDTIEIPGDTVYIPCDTVDRTFQLQDDWGRYRIDLRGNRALLAYDIKNSTSVDLSWQKQGFFKPALPVIMVTDHNPHSRTKETQFMMVNKKPPGKKALRLIEKVGFFAGGYLLGRL